MTKHSFVKVISAAALMAATVFPASAHGAEEKEKRFDESQYRHDVMELAKYSVSNIVQLLKGKASHDGHMQVLADVLAKSATLSIVSFEKDTRGIEGKTEAEDKIWENWQDFAERMDAYTADTATFANIVKTGDPAQIGAAFKRAVKHCKSCHDDYRK